MNSNYANPAMFLGRIFLALLFVVSGVGKVTGYAATAALMASKGLPMVDILLPLTIAVELGGGLLLALDGRRAGRRRRYFSS
jgi:putative oxidoreductase